MPTERSATPSVSERQHHFERHSLVLVVRAHSTVTSHDARAPSSREDRGPRGELVPRTATEVADRP